MPKTAKDLMTEKPMHVQSGASIMEATDFFLEKEVTSAPVINPLGELLGVLTDLGLVKSFLLQHASISKHDKIAHHLEVLEKAEFVSEETAVLDVVKAMIKAKAHRVLVVNDKGKLTGIVSPTDILLFLKGQQKKSHSLKEQLKDSEEHVEKLKGEVSDLRDNLDRYQGLFSETPYMMHSIDENAKIIMANKKIHQVLGFEPGELVGKTLFDIYPKTVQHEALAGLKKIQKEGFHHLTYTSMKKKSGELVRVDIVSSSLHDHYGKFLSTISVAREIDSEALLRALHGVFRKIPLDQDHIDSFDPDEKED
jgi:PAS domain S-box-containing protein